MPTKSLLKPPRQKTLPLRRISPPDVGIDNFRKVYQSARPWEKEEGKAYYREFNLALRHVAGELSTSLHVCAGIFAALSPNNSEENNWKDMIACIRHWQEEKWGQPKIHTFKHRLEPAREIWSGFNPTFILTTPKVNNFYRNLIWPEDKEAVTVDGHMFNCWEGIRRALNEVADRSPADYDMVACGIRELASELGLIPNQLQAILWLTWGRMHNILTHRQVVFPFMRVPISLL